jgi:sulfatase maturation enzyme AslB (radical SAM superfamily)
LHKQRFNQNEDSVDALPAQLQILFNNTCDLKCVYCNSDYSSQWAVEDKKYLSKEIIKVTANTEFQNIFWDWLTNVSCDKILRYYILGGEPLIQPEFYDFLDKLIPLIKNNPNVFGIKPELIISTNGNTPAKYLNKWFERLEKIQEVITVQMTISLEGTEEQAEYIRSNLNWKLFEQNVNSLFASAKKYNTKIRFAISQSALSITSTLELIKWIKQLKDLYKIEIDLIKQVITFPSHLSTCILDKTFDKYVNETCEWIRYNAPEWQDYIQFLQGISDNFNNCSADDRVNFLEFTTTMRERRNLDFLEVFPEMLIWYNSLHKYHAPSRIL